ncbi:MAG TPA: hypothetical protein VMI31_02675 [Fimbriimonadaceae bacterium]|nr:hypothetical protein [Fimbriimonadaceae bacterium]
MALLPSDVRSKDVAEPHHVAQVEHASGSGGGELPDPRMLAQEALAVGGLDQFGEETLLFLEMSLQVPTPKVEELAEPLIVRVSLETVGERENCVVIA